jgi:hypothetical protein
MRSGIREEVTAAAIKVQAWQRPTLPSLEA